MIIFVCVQLTAQFMYREYYTEKDKTKDSYLRTAVANYLEKWCDDNGFDLYADGLKIYTTIDSRMQKHAELAMQDWMKTLQRYFADTTILMAPSEGIGTNLNKEFPHHTYAPYFIF